MAHPVLFLASVPLLAWPAAALIGVSLGMLGSGGSILTVPLLHGAALLSVPDSTATSLPVVGLVALAGLVNHAARGSVRLREAVPFAIPSVLGAFAARRWLAPLVPVQVQVLAFAALMFVAAARMGLSSPPEEETPRDPHALPAVVALGLLVGGVTGLLGIGGGFLIFPALVLLLGMDVRQAVGTSLAVIASNCAAGLAGHYAGPPGSVPGEVVWPVAFLFSAAGILGTLLGTRLVHRLRRRVVRRTFAVVVLVVAIWLVADHVGTV